MAIESLARKKYFLTSEQSVMFCVRFGSSPSAQTPDFRTHTLLCSLVLKIAIVYHRSAFFSFVRKYNILTSKLIAMIL
jgi:hypothetical protein